MERVDFTIKVLQFFHDFVKEAGNLKFDETDISEERFLDEIIPLLKKHWPLVKNVPPAMIVQAYIKTYAVGGQFIAHIIPEEVMLVKIADEFGTSVECMKKLVDEYSAEQYFVLHDWRNFAHFACFVRDKLASNR